MKRAMTGVANPQRSAGIAVASTDEPRLVPHGADPPIMPSDHSGLPASHDCGVCQTPEQSAWLAQFVPSAFRADPGLISVRPALRPGDPSLVGGKEIDHQGFSPPA